MNDLSPFVWNIWYLMQECHILNSRGCKKAPNYQPKNAKRIANSSTSWLRCKKPANISTALAFSGLFRVVPQITAQGCRKIKPNRNLSKHEKV